MNDQPMCLKHQEPIYGYCQRCHDEEVGKAAIQSFAKQLTEGERGVGDGKVCREVCIQNIECGALNSCPIRKAGGL